LFGRAKDFIVCFSIFIYLLFTAVERCKLRGVQGKAVYSC